MYMISIDPGIDSGMIIWRGGRKAAQYQLVHAFTARGKGSVWKERAEDCVEKVAGEVIDYFCIHNQSYRTRYEVYIEWPKIFDSVGGRAAAHQGSIVKLSALCGMLNEAFRHHPRNVNTIFVPVNEWKGQMKKKLTVSRIKKILTPEEYSILDGSEHQWDAVGIGLHAQGRFY